MSGRSLHHFWANLASRQFGVRIIVKLSFELRPSESWPQRTLGVYDCLCAHRPTHAYVCARTSALYVRCCTRIRCVFVSAVDAIEFRGDTMGTLTFYVVDALSCCRARPGATGYSWRKQCRHNNEVGTTCLVAHSGLPIVVVWWSFSGQPREANLLCQRFALNPAIFSASCGHAYGDDHRS